MNQQVVLAALGGGLLAYGITQRIKAKQTDEILAKSVAQGEGTLCIGLGAILLVTAAAS